MVFHTYKNDRNVDVKIENSLQQNIVERYSIQRMKK